MHKIAVIPARGGSKRIPRKNIKEFFGQPLIAYSIQAAIKADCFERVVVDTDDEEIAEVARQFGAETPYLRSAEFADDYATTAAVISNSIAQLNRLGISADLLCCIYATAPFLRSEYLRKGGDLLMDQGSSYAFSVTTFPFPIQRAIKLNKEGRVDAFQPEYRNTRSQDLEEAYHDAGQFYWGTRDAWESEEPIFSPASVPVVLPRYLVQDIDTPEDWQRAELMFEAVRTADLQSQ